MRVRSADPQQGHVVTVVAMTGASLHGRCSADRGQSWRWHQPCGVRRHTACPERVHELEISRLKDSRTAGYNRYIGEMRSLISERKLVLLIGAGQFISTLDFTMTLPLGPDFAKALGIPVSELGMIGGSYIAAEVVAGIAGAFFLDRFARRRALAVALTGLVVATAACGLATGFVSLLAARILAGMFGGTAETLAFAIVSDAVA